MPRMQILSSVEHEAFELPPVFTSAQRHHHFGFSPELEQLALTLRTPTNQLGFLLSWGYFTATKRFFAPQTFRPADVEYVANRLGVALDSVDLSTYDKQSVARHQEIILQQLGFRAFAPTTQTWLEHELVSLVRAQLKPRLIFWRCVDLLIREKVEVPTYFRLADLILGAINHHKQHLMAILDQTLRPPTRRLLDDLFVQSPTLDGDPVDTRTAPYKLTLLKHLSQSTKPAKIKARVSDLTAVAELYQRLQPVLAALALPPDSIRYYAHSVLKAEIFQMARRADDDRYLHVVAFIAHQYYRLQDNLVDVLLTTVQSYQHSTQREHKDLRYAHRAHRKQLLTTLVGFMEDQLVTPLRAIREITEQLHLTDTEKITQIRAHLPHPDAQALATLRTEVATELSEEDYFSLLEARSVRIQNRVSPILKALTFQGEARI
jgi:Domain of unknown function (DUF4158)